MTNKEKSALQKEIVDSLDTNPHGRLLLAPRVGKTKIGIDIIKRDKPKSILWVTPSAELADVDIPKEFETWKAKRFVKNLTTVTWMSLNKITGHFDLIILDEEQFATENNLSNFFVKDYEKFKGELTTEIANQEIDKLVNILESTITYGNIITMTGTPTKHQEKVDLYKKLDLKPLYSISINNAVDVGLLSNYTMKIVEVDMSDDKTVEAGSKEKKFMTSEKLNYDYLNKIAQQAIYGNRGDAGFRIMNRMRAIKNSQSKLEAAKFLINSNEGRKLIFAGTILQSEQLCDHLYNSKTDNTELKQFQAGDIDEIAMVNSGGTGFTYREIDHLFLVQADSDKNGLTSQKLARTLLQQPNYHATIWIFVLIGTQDEKWVESTLQNFDKSKIEYIRFKNLINQQDFSNSGNSLDMFKKHGVKEIQSGSKTYKI